jgi:hypothetical protein
MIVSYVVLHTLGGYEKEIVYTLVELESHYVVCVRYAPSKNIRWSTIVCGASYIESEFCRGKPSKSQRSGRG